MHKKLTLVLLFSLICQTSLSKEGVDNNSKKLNKLRKQLSQIQSLEKDVEKKIEQLILKPKAKSSFLFSVDPIFLRKIDKEQSISTGIEYTRESKNSLLSASFQYNWYKIDYFVSKTTSKTETFEFKSSYEKMKFFGDFSLISQFNELRDMEDDILLTVNEVEFGPIGIAYPLVERDSLRLIFGLIPLYEYSVKEAEQIGITNSSGNKVYIKVYSKGVRTSFQLSLNYTPDKNPFNYSSQIYLQPIYNLGTDKFVFKDNKFRFENTFRYRMHPYISTDLSVDLSHNLQQKRVQGLPSTDIKTTLTFNFHKIF